MELRWGCCRKYANLMDPIGIHVNESIKTPLTPLSIPLRLDPHAVSVSIQALTIFCPRNFLNGFPASINHFSLQPSELSSQNTNEVMLFFRWKLLFKTNTIPWPTENIGSCIKASFPASSPNPWPDPSVFCHTDPSLVLRRLALSRLYLGFLSFLPSLPLMKLFIFLDPSEMSYLGFK